jgi:hypothetical protein
VVAVDRVASLPEAFRVDDFVDGLDSVRFEVSSFLRLEDRGESSMAAVGRCGATDVWLIGIRY